MIKMHVDPIDAIILHQERDSVLLSIFQTASCYYIERYKRLGDFSSGQQLLNTSKDRMK